MVEGGDSPIERRRRISLSRETRRKEGRTRRGEVESVSFWEVYC
jgi:hypothetical protein